MDAWLPALSLAYATGCDGGTLRVRPLNTDARGQGEALFFLKFQASPLKPDS